MYGAFMLLMHTASQVLQKACECEGCSAEVLPLRACVWAVCRMGGRTWNMEPYSSQFKAPGLVLGFYPKLDAVEVSFAQDM